MASTVTVALSVLILGVAMVTVDACMCAKRPIQQRYCTSEVVLLAKLVNETSYVPEQFTDVPYKRFYSVYRYNLEYLDVFKFPIMDIAAPSTISTGSSFSCGGQLKEGRTYIITPSLNNDLELSTDRCSVDLVTNSQGSQEALEFLRNPNCEESPFSIKNPFYFN